MTKLKPEKAELRQKMLDLRLALKPDKISIKSSMIATKLILLKKNSGRKILTYIPINNEVDTTYINNYLETGKKQLYLPAFVKKNWIITKYELEDMLVKGPYNTSQPQRINKADPQSLDLVLLPGLAFSKKGARLGYGKGAYDRLLSKTNCLKVGICYDFQIVNNLEPQNHDILVDFLVSDKRIIRCDN